MKRILPLLLLSVFLLVSCSSEYAENVFGAIKSYADSTVELIENEAPGIIEIFEGESSTKPSETAQTAETDRPNDGILKTDSITILTETLYNSSTSTATSASLDANEVAAPENLNFSDAEAAGYVRIPSLANMSVTDAEAEICAYGITPLIRERTNPSPAGTVYAVTFCGIASADEYLVNPDNEFVLWVSTEKAAKTAKEGDNLVYLTFDDGPGEETRKLVEILDTWGVKATFFTMGSAMQKYPANAKLAADHGHTIGCHTMTHVYDDIYESADALSAEIDQWEGAAASAGITLSEKRLFRFPGGSVGKYLTEEKLPAMKEMLNERHYLAFDWNVVINDAVLYTAPYGESSYDFIKESLISTYSTCLAENAGKTGAPVIILMHENVRETADLLPWILNYLTEQGAVFGDLSNLESPWTFAERNE